MTPLVRFVLLAVGLLLAASPVRADQAFIWVQGQPTMKLVPAETNYCYLVRVQGKFMGYGEQVRLRVINGFWTLGGTSQQQDVQAIARCFARSEVKAAPNAVRWASEEISATADTAGGGCVDTFPKAAWWGDAATVLTLVTGALRGGGERLTINQSGDPFGASTLILHSCQKQLGMGVYSFFVGIPSSGRSARFIGPNGTGTAGQAGEYTVFPGQQTLMAPTFDAFCYFTEINGKFDGGAESAEILSGGDANGQSRWLLRTSSSGTSSVSAKARCYAKDQR